MIDFIDKAGSNSLKILFLFDDIKLLIAIGQLFPSNQIFPFNFLSFFEKKLISKKLTFGPKFSTKSLLNFSFFINISRSPFFPWIAYDCAIGVLGMSKPLILANQQMDSGRV